MPYLIGLQAGHQFITRNCVVNLRPETGAKGEMELNVRIRDRLGEILISKGFQVQLDDANGNCNANTVNKDFSFYLAIHAEGEPSGGCISAPDPSVDQANIYSKSICNAIESEYFHNAGIEDKPQLITDNMTFYYMWSVLSANTPCGIIELGGIADPHDSVILADTDRVCNALARGICKAFNVPFDPVPPVPQPAPVVPDYKQFSGLVLQIVNGKAFAWDKVNGIKKLASQMGIK